MCLDSVADFVKSHGKDNLTVDDIVKAIRPFGRANVPDSIKAELLNKLRKEILS